MQADIYENFKHQVRNSRGDKIKVNELELFSGAIWSGSQAVEAGLADKVGDLYGEMQERFGDEVEIRIVNQEKSWLKRKLGMALEAAAQSLGQFIVTEKKFDLR